MLEATSRHTEAETRDAAIVTTLYCCGLRVSEIGGLDWQDLDLGRGQGWLKGKGRREKELFVLPAAAVESIRRNATHRGTAPCPVFLTRGTRGKHRDRRLETRSVLRLVRVLGAKVGLHVWCHALRHASLTAAATLGAKAGLSLNDIRAHSRHASVLTLQRYLDQHNVVQTKRVVADLVADSLKG